MDRSLPDVPQRFVISRHDEAAFKADGLRDYSACELLEILIPAEHETVNAL